MAATRFDAISRLFARRKAGTTVSRTAAPSGSGSATPAAAWTGEKIPYLFVQSFERGTIAPKQGDEGSFTVTLEHGLGQTLYFSDRPGRDAGAVPTEQFLEGLGFPDDNPPNAALLVDDGEGDTGLAVVELRNPVYDEATQTATYDVAILADWEESTELGLTEAPADLSALPESFGPAHLFIDDCTSTAIACELASKPVGYLSGLEGGGFCYNYLICMPCEPYGHVQPDKCATFHYWAQKCDNEVPECRNGCLPYWASAELLGCY